jgi:hypothetical protein
MKYLAILLVSLLLADPTLRAQDSSNPTDFQSAQSEEHQVWVNTATGIYHYPGTRWYGHTKQGKFMSEKDAIAQDLGLRGMGSNPHTDSNSITDEDHP